MSYKIKNWLSPAWQYLVRDDNDKDLKIVLHTDEFWVLIRGLNGTGTVGTAGTPVITFSRPDCGLGFNGF